MLELKMNEENQQEERLRQPTGISEEGWGQLKTNGRKAWRKSFKKELDKIAKVNQEKFKKK